MAEKGGKLLPKGTKSSLTSSHSSLGSSKRKENCPTKSKKGRKVQFDSSIGSTKSADKTESMFDKVNLGKGGKEDKTGNAAKKTPVKDPQPLELKIEQELPECAKCMMDAEALHILQGIQDQMVILSEDPSIKIPISFDRGLQYAKSTGNHYTDYQSVRSILEKLKKDGVNEGELCVIANACPETADEVFALVPSLKAKRSKLIEPLKGVLSELVKLKQSS
ncbi:hypothetical protein SAY87_001301 [Trapa incisa]|uniref:RNA polymerase Rpb4/RPC9 core domain-containing protein n=1 Tax=Trapa incisa TaxID=236973 RepID=A0AAN7GD03_9MYRT|nr:hypothetical protein SAY87_001301 [Trapa incisa]